MTDDLQFGLKAETIDKIRSVFAGFEQIRSVILYGSRAKGNFKPGSDIDLTLVTEGELPNSFLGRVEMAIDDLELIYLFDISLLHEIDNKNLRDHIERVGVDFYNAEEYARRHEVTDRSKSSACE